MYRYTPKKTILRYMKVGGLRPWDKEYFRRKEILSEHGLSPSYELNSVLQVHYPNVAFYSKTMRKQVPVNGYLFPVSMFNEELVS